MISAVLHSSAVPPYSLSFLHIQMTENFPIPTRTPSLAHNRLYFSFPKSFLWLTESTVRGCHQLSIPSGSLCKKKNILAAGLGQSCCIIHHWELRVCLLRVRLAKQLHELTTSPIAASFCLFLNLVSLFLTWCPRAGEGWGYTGQPLWPVHSGVVYPWSDTQHRHVFY